VSGILSYVLLERGFSVGRFTSPHLLCICDRFWVNGERVDVDRVADAYFNGVVPFLEKGGELSFFETTFAIALVLFYEEPVEWAVLEAGLGGRLDATSSLVADAILLTSVARDHVRILGGSLWSILTEKVAQWRGQPLFANVRSSVLKEVLRGRGEVYFQGEDFGVSEVRRSLGEMECVVHAFGEKRRIRSERFWVYPQELNFAVVGGVYKFFFKELDDRFVAGCEKARLLGRGDLVEWRGKRLLLDGAHNPQSLVYLGNTLRKVGRAPVDVVFFLQPTKELRSSCVAVSRFARRVFLAIPPSSPKKTPLEVLRESFEETGVEAKLCESVQEALDSVEDFGVVCGSFYLVSDAYRILMEESV
jgi:dihydrofolate synthase/folylpolyglutamate synthase